MKWKSVVRGAALSALVAGAAFGTSACDGRPRSAATKAPSDPVTGPSLAVFDLSVGIPEKEQVGWLGSPSGRRRSFDALIKAFGVAKKDKDTAGFYVRFGSTSFGLARDSVALDGLYLLTGRSSERVKRGMQADLTAHAVLSSYLQR